MPEKTPILQVKKITKAYGSNVILDNISFDINEGEIKVLIGSSGTGKSTMLHCINFLTKPTSGEVVFEGRPINPNSGKELIALRQKVGMIFQNFNLFDHLTAKDNVAIGLIKVKGLSKEAAFERAMKELDQVGLKKLADNYPSQLSGGQQQRVSIARTLAMDPRMVLLDEPTSALDPELMAEVLDVISDLASGGMTMLMVTHEIKFAATVANEFIMLDSGHIIEQGPPDQILNNPQHPRTQQFCSMLNEH